MSRLKRRIEGKTNYRKRLKLLLSDKVRFVIRKSNHGIRCQFIEYKKEGDHVLVSISSEKLNTEKLKLKKKQIDYLTGYLCAILAKGKIKSAVLDMGLQDKGERIFSALKGAIDGGIKIPCDEAIFPKEERIESEKLQKIGNELLSKVKPKEKDGKKKTKNGKEK